MRGAYACVVGGLIVLVVVLAAASAAGFALRQRQGRFQQRKSNSAGHGTDAAGTGTRPGAAPLTAADLGAPLGERATLVQFSTEYCVYCPPTRAMLAEVAADADGVAFVEIDAAHRLDLARRLRVFSTPTVLVLAPDGTIAQRASGRPRKSELLAAVSGVLGEESLS